MRREDTRFQDLNATVEALPAQYLPVRGLATLPAGEYFVGDPYLLFSEGDQGGWNKWVAEVGQTQEWENQTPPLEYRQPVVGALYNGAPVMGAKMLSSGAHWSVAPAELIPSESGLLGLIPMKTVEELGFTKADLRQRHMGTFHTFGKQAQMVRNKYGDLYLTEEVAAQRPPELLLITSKHLSEEEELALKINARKYETGELSEATVVDMNILAKFVTLSANAVTTK